MLLRGQEGSEGNTLLPGVLVAQSGELQSFAYSATRFPRFPLTHVWASMVSVMRPCSVSIGIIFTGKSFSEDTQNDRENRKRETCPTDARLVSPCAHPI